MMRSTSATRLSPRTKQARANAGLTTEFVPNPITAFAVKLSKAHSLRRVPPPPAPVPPVRGIM
jgi:hypothetical protein